MSLKQYKSGGDCRSAGTAVTFSGADDLTQQPVTATATDVNRHKSRDESFIVWRKIMKPGIQARYRGFIRGLICSHRVLFSPLLPSLCLDA
ncbi:TPA: hypothetical protein JG914_000084 [Enterobacter hormaechei subsp. steigerwaltii]|nr:hypothetical protein [Enterobacter hormaechei subsp. steigerwaltii]